MLPSMSVPPDMLLTRLVLPKLHPCCKQLACTESVSLGAHSHFCKACCACGLPADLPTPQPLAPRQPVLGDAGHHFTLHKI